MLDNPWWSIYMRTKSNVCAWLGILWGGEFLSGSFTIRIRQVMSYRPFFWAVSFSTEEFPNPHSREVTEPTDSILGAKQEREYFFQPSQK